MSQTGIWSDLYRGHTKGPSYSSRCDEVEDPSSCNSSQALSHHIEQCFCQAQLSSYDHGCSDGWVNVSTTDVAKTLHHSGDAQAKAQGDEDQVSWGRLLLPCSPVDGGAQTEKDKDESGEVFSRHSPPEVLGPDPFKSHHYTLTVTPGQEPPGKKNNEQND